MAVLAYDLLTHPWSTHAIGFGVEFYDAENELIVSSYPDCPFGVLAVYDRVHIGGSLFSWSGPAF